MKFKQPSICKSEIVHSIIRPLVIILKNLETMVCFSPWVTPLVHQQLNNKIKKEGRGQ